MNRLAEELEALYHVDESPANDKFQRALDWIGDSSNTEIKARLIDHYIHDCLPTLENPYYRAVERLGAEEQAKQIQNIKELILDVENTDPDEMWAMLQLVFKYFGVIDQEELDQSI